MKNNSEISILLVKLRPGYAPGAVHYFYRRNAGCVSDSEQELIDNLRMRTMRHGMEFITGDAPAAQLRGAAISRLFNAGNLLSESYVYILPTVSDESFAASFEPMFDRILDFENWESENVDATNYFAGEWMMFSREQESHDDDLCYSESDIPPECSRHRDKHITYSARPGLGPSPCLPEELERVDETDEEAAVEQQCRNLQDKQREMLRRIGQIVSEYVRQFHEMPDLHQLAGATDGLFIIDGERFSPVRVNGNLDIILPYYDEMKLRLTPLCRTVYILFLRHPEGIVLKEIADYRNELLEIYSLVKPGADDRLANASVDDLCSPLSDSLQQKISMIKRNICRQLINPAQQRHYSINGARGRKYAIEAAADAVLPAALA